MFGFFKHFGRSKAASTTLSSSADLPSIARDSIAPLLVIEEGLPQVDWGMANAWIEHQIGAGQWPGEAYDLRRAIAAAWLDELRDSLTTDSRRWRSAAVEGLAPLEGTTGQRLATGAERSIAVIGQALRDIRGNPEANPIPPIGIVALATADEYYSFISHFYEEEGEYATSGGLYLRGANDEFPILVINTLGDWQLERTLAHELTHHALRADAACAYAGDLPMWAEEGLTQMMEEHVTRVAMFHFDHDMLRRHQALWERIGFDDFASGDSFHSPRGQEQELSYNLAEALVRSLATTRRSSFFAFVRACLYDGLDHETAAREHLGGTVQELAEAFVWRG